MCAAKSLCKAKPRLPLWGRCPPKEGGEGNPLAFPHSPCEGPLATCPLSHGCRRASVSAAASGAVCQWQTSSTDRRGSGDRALNGAHRAPAPPATFEKVDETFTRLRRARELIIRTGVSVAHRPKARLARGATPANCPGCNPRELSRAATHRELTAEALRRELRAQALGLKCGALS